MACTALKRTNTAEMLQLRAPLLFLLDCIELAVDPLAQLQFNRAACWAAVIATFMASYIDILNAAAQNLDARWVGALIQQPDGTWKRRRGFENWLLWLWLREMWGVCMRPSMFWFSLTLLALFCWGLSHRIRVGY
mmetsp:Transcript_3385/g.7688  ORF Transcript_3385/g.7688 Transcript_3385/m.7688 type:complete len:135 (-) Transcript_3385:191-595(-)